MDSPISQHPVPASEKPILEQLLIVRDKLLLLKQDKTTYVKSQDVIPLYETVIEQVHQLNNVRGPDHLLQNRVDHVLDDSLQLISLFFMAVGRNNEAPALYSMTSTVTRLCDHLKEAGFYSTQDLDTLAQALAKMEATLEKGKEQYSPYLLTRIQYRLEICQALLKELRDFLSTLGPVTLQTWEQLVSLLRSLAALSMRNKYSLRDLNALRAKLHVIQARIEENKTADAEAEPSSGQKLVEGLLKRCLYFAEQTENRQGKVNEKFEEIFYALSDIRNHLERLSMTQAWSLREPDLFMWQRKLDRIDDARRDGNFFDADGKPADLYTQRVLLYLLRRSYGYIYQLLIASEPVSEALLPVYNQLLTLRRCLVEVKKAGGLSSPRELYPYSMKLNSIDKMRVDGKFKVGKDIPEGQGSVIDLLTECHDLVYELRTAAAEAEHEEHED